MLSNLMIKCSEYSINIQGMSITYVLRCKLYVAELRVETNKDVSQRIILNSGQIKMNGIFKVHFWLLKYTYILSNVDRVSRKQ